MPSDYNPDYNPDRTTGDTSDPFAIPRLTILTGTILTGHVSADTAYVVHNHPYGGVLTCTVRYWVETCQSGPHKGDQRFVHQSTNPRLPETADGPAWNNPRPETYDTIVVMYLDDRGRVRPYGVPDPITGPLHARVHATGVYAALTGAQRAHYEQHLAASRQTNAAEWKAWSETINALAGHIATTGTDPHLDIGKWWPHNGHRYYLSDPAAYVTAARMLAARI
jgi:hypothetical protein